MALSPDGSTIVYRALRDGQLQLFVRTLAEAAPRPLAGTANAALPCLALSPLSRCFGLPFFWGKLLRIGAALGERGRLFAFVWPRHGVEVRVYLVLPPSRPAWRWVTRGRETFGSRERVGGAKALLDLPRYVTDVDLLASHVCTVH